MLTYFVSLYFYLGRVSYCKVRGWKFKSRLGRRLYSFSPNSNSIFFVPQDVLVLQQVGTTWLPPHNPAQLLFLIHKFCLNCFALQRFLLLQVVSIFHTQFDNPLQRMHYLLFSKFSSKLLIILYFICIYLPSSSHDKTPQIIGIWGLYQKRENFEGSKCSPQKITSEFIPS